nr:hypothetical protein [Pseudomonas caspiana]
MDYEQLPRAALVRMLQEHDAALADAGKNGIVMSYTGRAAPWQIIRQVNLAACGCKLVRAHSRAMLPGPRVPPPALGTT